MSADRCSQAETVQLRVLRQRGSLGVLICALVFTIGAYAEPDLKLVRVPYPKGVQGYRPKGFVAVADGFLLGGEVMRAGTGWDVSLTKVSPQLVPGQQMVLAGDRTDDLVGVRVLNSGYILLANTSSRRGDLRARYGIQDMNLLRVNREGEILWSADLGGTGLNQAIDLVVDESNGAVTALGWVNQGGGAVPKTYGELDVVVGRYDKSGGLQWVTVLGAKGDDLMGSLVVAGERTWVLYSGWSRRDRWQMYLVQLDAMGREVRRNEFGGRGSELSADLVRLDDGDLLLLGTTDTDDRRYGEPHGKTDILLMQVSERGNIRWQARFGGSETDLAHSLVAGQGGEYWVLGMTQSGDGDMPRHLGGNDVVLLRVGSKGELLDSHTYGTADEDVPLQIVMRPGTRWPTILGAVRISENLSDPFLILEGRSVGSY